MTHEPVATAELPPSAAGPGAGRTPASSERNAAEPDAAQPCSADRCILTGAVDVRGVELESTNRGEQAQAGKDVGLYQVEPQQRGRVRKTRRCSSAEQRLRPAGRRTTQGAARERPHGRATRAGRTTKEAEADGGDSQAGHRQRGNRHAHARFADGHG